MSYLSDYLMKRRSQGQSFVPTATQPQSAMTAAPQTMRQQSVLTNPDKFYGLEPASIPPHVDSSNAINSLASLLGPTPDEREAQQRRLDEGRSKMAAWTGLFDGLRQLGNLYYTSKGASPQTFADPYAQIDKEAKDAQQRLDDMANYRRAYAQQLYALQRQSNADQRQSMLAQAQAKYYDTRDEVARMKAENERLKNEKYIELQDGRIAKLNAETGKIEALLPYQQREIQSRTNKNDRTGGGHGGGGAGLGWGRGNGGNNETDW